MSTAACPSPQQLIEDNQGLVRSLAAAIHRKLPPSAQLEDLIAYGEIGLAEAARDFDPSRGSQFSTYAYYRVRGAIYDGLSKMMWHSRSHYHRIRCEQMSGEVLRVQAEEGEKPADADLAGEVRWFREVAQGLAVVQLATGCQSEDRPGPKELEDASTPPPFAAAIDREISERLHQLIDALPAVAGSLIRATYFEGLTLQEAGQRLGLSKSWASRLHAKTLRQLGRSLRQVGIST